MGGGVQGRVRSTLCIPDQSCLRDGAFTADLRPDVLHICVRVLAPARHPIEVSYYKACNQDV